VSLRNLIVALLVIAFGGGGAYYFSRTGGPPAGSYTTQEVTRGRIEAKVTSTGTLSPLVTVQVGSQISGRVVALFADFNSEVKKGQVIAKLDTALLEAAVEQSRANLIAAEGNLARSRAQALDAGRQATRSAELLVKKLVAQADADTAESNKLAAEAGVKAAQGQVALARAALSQTQINLRYATIYSPINGIVISRSVDVGQTVAATMTAPILFQIAEDLKKMQVDTAVAESDVGKVKTGMDVTFKVDAYPTETFVGKVRQIRNAATTVQNVVTYDAVIDVDNSELKLKPGMTTTVSFVYAESKDVLKIPSAALRYTMPKDPTKPGSGKAKGDEAGDKKRDVSSRMVWTLRDKATTPVQVPIRIGISDGTSIEVVEGLAERQLVVVDSTDAPGEKKAPKGGGRRSF